MNDHVVGWVALVALVVVCLAVDFDVHRGDRQINLRKAAMVSVAWVCVSVAVGVTLGTVQSWDVAGQFFAGYLIEKSLSIDNILLFAVLLRAFAVPVADQRRVLSYGVLGALVMRAGFVVAGTLFVRRVGWAEPAFGVLVLLAAVRMARGVEHVDPEHNLVVKGVRRFVPVTSSSAEGRFFSRVDGTWAVTPLFLALVAIEVTDVVLAADSIPAIFSVTTDSFVVFAANACAVLGLRALYFVLAGAIGRFAHVGHGLVLLLGLIGIRMILGPVVSIPLVASLATIAAIITASIVLSVAKERRQKKSHEEDGHDDQLELSGSTPSS
jgi:tellurite resistance protein TerC